MYPIIDKKKTAMRINLFMFLNDLTPSDIQEYLGLTCVQTVYRWLEGINIPSIDNLYALSELFHVPIDTMISGNRQYCWSNSKEETVLRLLFYQYEIIKRKKRSWN